MHVVDEARLRVVTLPIMHNRRLLAIPEDETRNVERIGAGMLAELAGGAGADNRPAREAAEMLDRHDRTPHVARGGRRDDMLDKHREIDGERATRDKTAAESRRAPDGDALDIV